MSWLAYVYLPFSWLVSRVFLAADDMLPRLFRGCLLEACDGCVCVDLVQVQRGARHR